MRKKGDLSNITPSFERKFKGGLGWVKIYSRIELMGAIRTYILIMLLCAFLGAITIEEKQEELDTVHRELARQQELLQQARQREQASLRDLFVINRKVNQVKGSLQYNQVRLYRTDQNLQQTREELQKKQEEYQLRQNLLARRIREIYKSQDLGFLALLFSNRSFSDVVDSSFYYRKIMEKDLGMIYTVGSLKRDIQYKERVLQQQRQTIANTHKVITQQKQYFEREARQKQNIYTSLKSQRREYERRVEGLLQNSREIESLIKQMIRTGTVEARGTGRFIWPVRGMITSYYGNRRHPIFRIVRFHTGLDIGVNSGVPIKAADSGVVIFAGWWGGYGKAVIIEHGRGYSTVYGHLSRIYVKKGMKIDKYVVLGLVGSTGYSTGPHLHFEVRRNGETRDPLRYLP